MTTLLGKMKKPLAFGGAYVSSVLALVTLVIGCWWYGVEVLRAFSGILLELMELIHQSPQLGRIVDWLMMGVVSIVLLVLLASVTSYFARKFPTFGWWLRRIIGGMFLILVAVYLLYAIWACTEFGFWNGVFYPFRHLVFLKAYVSLIGAGWDWIYSFVHRLLSTAHSLQLPIGERPVELVPNFYLRAALGVILLMVAAMLFGKSRQLFADKSGIVKRIGPILLIAFAAFGLILAASMQLYPMLIIGACLILGMAARKWVGDLGSPGLFVLWGLMPIVIYAISTDPRLLEFVQTTISMTENFGQHFSSEWALIGTVIAYCAWAILGGTLFFGYTLLYPLTVPALLFWFVLFYAEPWLRKLALV